MLSLQSATPPLRSRLQRPIPGRRTRTAPKPRRTTSISPNWRPAREHADCMPDCLQRRLRLCARRRTAARIARRTCTPTSTSACAATRRRLTTASSRRHRRPGRPRRSPTRRRLQCSRQARLRRNASGQRVGLVLRATNTVVPGAPITSPPVTLLALASRRGSPGPHAVAKRGNLCRRICRPRALCGRATHHARLHT